MNRAIAALTALVLMTVPAAAQDWPTRSPTMVVPYAAGGGVPAVQTRLREIEKWAGPIKAAGLVGQ